MKILSSLVFEVFPLNIYLTASSNAHPKNPQ